MEEEDGNDPVERETSHELILRELESVRQTIADAVEGCELIACLPQMVRVRLVRTRYKQLTVCMQFPENYPHNSILVELKSKVFSEKLCDTVTKKLDEEILKWHGQRQVILAVKFLRSFIDDNPLSVCSDEVAFIKKELIAEQDELKIKQKTGILTLNLKEQSYFMNFKLYVGDQYPAEAVRIEPIDTNFPDMMCKVFYGQAVDMSRQSVQPPLRRKTSEPPFEPKPSLQLVATHLIRNCARRYPKEHCPLCLQQALPTDPKDVVTDSTNDMYLERVYCGHLFHRSCLNTFLSTPPFTGGKKCPGCGIRIYHEKWAITSNLKLAEDRWAHQEARKRELDEVMDFLE